MATITTRSFSQFVETFVVAAQATAIVLLDFSVGSVGRAYAEAASAFALWFQYQCLILLARTRAQTSVGPDLDSWMAQWPLGPNGGPFTRLLATFATGLVQFTVNNTTQAAVIPVGSAGIGQVQTSDTTQSFWITQNTFNPYYNATLNAYVLPIGLPSALLPVMAVTAGTAGNVGIGTITSVTDGTITNIASITNTAALIAGFNVETDTAFLARFQLAIAGIASADEAAIESAIANVQQGITYELVPNSDYPGTNTDYGSFFVIVDDGSHSPPTSLLTAVFNAISVVRGFTIRLGGVYAPSIVTMNVVGAITSAAGFTHGTVVEGVDAAWSTYINTLDLEAPALTIAGLAAVALTVPGCINVTLSTVLINGVNADYALSAIQVAAPGTISAS